MKNTIKIPKLGGDVRVQEKKGCIYIVRAMQPKRPALVLKYTSRKGDIEYITDISEIAEKIKRNQILHAVRFIKKYFNGKIKDDMINEFYPRIKELVSGACKDKIKDLKFLETNKNFVAELQCLFINAAKEEVSLKNHLQKIKGYKIIEKTIYP